MRVVQRVIHYASKRGLLLVGMTKGRRLQLPSAAFVRGGRGMRGTGGRGHPDSPDHGRASARDLDDRDRRRSRDAEDRPPKPLSRRVDEGKSGGRRLPSEESKETPPNRSYRFSRFHRWSEVDRPFGRLSQWL
ncbi:hypothetical protein Dimus_007916 [Dionaea muscipula]